MPCRHAYATRCFDAAEAARRKELPQLLLPPALPRVIAAR